MTAKKQDTELTQSHEFQITKMQPGTEIEANFPEIAAKIAEITDLYAGTIVSLDYLPQARKDRAYLNGLVKSVEQRRIEAKKAYMQPYDAFEAQVKTLLAHGREASANLDAQIKTLEEQERADNCLDNHAAVVHKLRAADARARHEARTSAWLAQFAADTIRGVNDVFREAIGERRSARITAFQPTAAELLTEAKEATRETR